MSAYDLIYDKGLLGALRYSSITNDYQLSDQIDQIVTRLYKTAQNLDYTPVAPDTEYMQSPGQTFQSPVTQNTTITPPEQAQHLQGPTQMDLGQAVLFLNNLFQAFKAQAGQLSNLSKVYHNPGASNFAKTQALDKMAEILNKIPANSMVMPRLYQGFSPQAIKNAFGNFGPGVREFFTNSVNYRNALIKQLNIAPQDQVFLYRKIADLMMANKPAWANKLPQFLYNKLGTAQNTIHAGLDTWTDKDKFAQEFGEENLYNKTPEQLKNFLDQQEQLLYDEAETISNKMLSIQKAVASDGGLHQVYSALKSNPNAPFTGDPAVMRYVDYAKNIIAQENALTNKFQVVEQKINNIRNNFSTSLDKHLPLDDINNWSEKNNFEQLFGKQNLNSPEEIRTFLADQKTSLTGDIQNGERAYFSGKNSGMPSDQLQQISDQVAKDTQKIQSIPDLEQSLISPAETNMAKVATTSSSEAEGILSKIFQSTPILRPLMRVLGPLAVAFQGWSGYQELKSRNFQMDGKEWCELLAFISNILAFIPGTQEVTIPLSLALNVGCTFFVHHDNSSTPITQSGVEARAQNITWGDLSGKDQATVSKIYNANKTDPGPAFNAARKNNEFDNPLDVMAAVYKQLNGGGVIPDPNPNQVKSFNFARYIYA